jgi:GTPase SAR1 family protein
MATKYELPEKVNVKRLRTLGKEVEMKTFKTNAPPEGETGENACLVKIVCVGDCTDGVRTKGVFLDDYRQVQPRVNSFRRPVVGVDFHLKTILWQRSETEEPVLTRLQFWEIGKQERFSNMTRLYYRFSHGALVFWGTRNPSSLDAATKWRQEVRNHLPSIPCVLITDNVAKPGQEPLQWIGPGKIFESEVALDQFCKDHGFVDHFEIKSRDWESGEKSVFGQAVNCLLDEILQTEQKEEKTWI